MSLLIKCEEVRGMLPATGGLLEQRFEVAVLPSRTFCLQDGRIIGYVDGVEAVRQTIEAILNIERFDWLIYSWNFGSELRNLFGKSQGLVKSKLKKRIREALMQDDRISGVDAFCFEISGRKLHAAFTVRTIFGDVEKEMEVDI